MPSTDTWRLIMTVLKAVENFDSLPDSAYIRIKDLEVLLAMSESTIRRRIQAGQIPKAKNLSTRVAAYNVGEVRQALANL